MSTTKDMETELFKLLPSFIGKNAEAPFRLAEQEAELRRRKCTNPELGRWVEVNDFPFLIDTLLLSDAVFSEEYPNVKLDAEERRRFAAALEEHCEGCDRCGFARASDLEWQSRVNRAFAENREAIGQVIARAGGKK